MNTAVDSEYLLDGDDDLDNAMETAQHRGPRGAAGNYMHNNNNYIGTGHASTLEDTSSHVKRYQTGNQTQISGRGSDGVDLPNNAGAGTKEQTDLSPINATYEQPSPVDHLVLLANQILSTLRDIILVRYRRGRSLHEIFQHFDRRGRGYFELRDFMRATADLRIEISERVAQLAIEIMALDSRSYVTFGEFKVFVLDSEHFTLIAQVQSQLGQLYERFGHGFDQYLLQKLQEEALLEKEETLSEELLNKKQHQSREIVAKSQSWKDRTSGTERTGSFSLPTSSSNHLNNGGNDNDGVPLLIGRDAFARVLKQVGLQLPTADMSRLLDRFDVFGHDECFVDRFLHMVVHCDSWTQAARNLRYQDRAQEEAALLRRDYHEQGNTRSEGRNNNSSTGMIPQEVVDMCEYLGIGVLSEENMVWIAVDALRAPLPVNWTVQQDAAGRNYFYNVLTNQARWEHPLDPHFRNLRDRYRQR